MNVVRTELNLAKTDKRFPKKGTCMAIYSRCVNAREKLDVVLRHHFPWCKDWTEELKQLFDGYVDRKEAAGVLDYDDLLLYWQALLGGEAERGAVPSAAAEKGTVPTNLRWCPPERPGGCCAQMGTVPFAAGEAVRRLFDCILVDEYQDTNTLQAEILYLLSPEGKGLTVVGDDAQSIYAFRAATVRNILDFPKHYPKATIVTLEQNYRSTQPILEAPIA